MPSLIPKPAERTLRIYAFDPSVSAQYETASVGEITIGVRWEELEKGPVGEYIEVVDVDPASGFAYRPVNLNDPWVLAQDGLAPSESNPQFHQQMVYAVAMATIEHFEQALGRVALWSKHREETGFDEAYVPRLRIYPHALRDKNAFYSPKKKALLFGYFPVTRRDADNSPGTVVFTCLSHDIIAHETTHALLDGVHPRFNEPVNPDVLAFHEAFADIVAIFQHFAYPGVLRDQIARSRGNLAGENLLGQLAQQFGKATGRGSALRDAIGRKNPKTGVWEPNPPDPTILDRTAEPHDRGAILVAAVFGAFLKVYRSRTLDLYRIATGGTGVLQDGAIHPDLSARLANEAASTARQILQMCIRAIDYCPPVGITFGDFLRGVVTADHDLNPEDSGRARTAFVDCFRQWGIHPRNVAGVSASELLWPAGTVHGMEQLTATEYADTKNRKRRFKPWDLEADRKKVWQEQEENRWALWGWLRTDQSHPLAEEIGIVINAAGKPMTINRSKRDKNQLAFEVHSVRQALRRTPRGSTVPVLVVEITQKRRGYFDSKVQAQQDAGKGGDVPADFTYRAGCTLLIDPKDLRIRRLIRTPGNILDDKALDDQRRFLTQGMSRMNAFDGVKVALDSQEPFALLHGEADGEGM